MTMTFEISPSKTIMQNFSEPDSVSRCFEYCFKKSKDLQVWPPSKEILKQELTTVSNTLTVYVAVKASMKYDRLPEFERVEQLICQSLNRVVQCVSESSSLLSNTLREQSISTVMQRFLDAMKDPIIHFRALGVLGVVVTMCGLTCLFVRMQPHNKTHIKQILPVFQEITNLLCKDTLQETLPYKNGQLEEKLTQNCNVKDFPSVQDFVSTVLCLNPSYARDCRVVYKPWQWLDIICLCKQHMSNQGYFSAMEHLEALLNTQLDLEIRSRVLCLFAECYLHQDCSQLALQTYKAALKADKNNHMVFFYLAEVYKKLKQDDLELESLNLLVRLLTDKHLRSRTLTPDLHLDALVCSLCDVLPTVELPGTLHHFAQRCSELHRYTEASEQYITLLKLLDEDLEYSSMGTTPGVHRVLDVKEVVVEAAESLALAQQVDQCLRLFDQFSPVLVANDTSFLSVCSATDTNISWSSINDSQDNLLGSQHQSQHDQCSVSFVRDEKKPGEADGANNSLPFENLCSLTRQKRLRSDSFSMDINDKDKESGSGQEQRVQRKSAQDPWWPTSLAVRLLLSKADVLIPNQGYTDEVMSCLYRAQDLLLKDPVSIFKHSNNSDTHSDVTKSPSLKRRKVTSDKLEAASTRSSSILHNDNSRTITIANQYEVSDIWRNTMLKVAERMQRAFLSGNQYTSACNVSKLLQQLAPDNQSAQANDPKR